MFMLKCHLFIPSTVQQLQWRFVTKSCFLQISEFQKAFFPKTIVFQWSYWLASSRWIFSLKFKKLIINQNPLCSEMYKLFCYFFYRQMTSFLSIISLLMQKLLIPIDISVAMYGHKLHKSTRFLLWYYLTLCKKYTQNIKENRIEIGLSKLVL